MNSFIYNQSIDGIYLNYTDELDRYTVENKKNYEMIDLFPKTKKIFEALEIEKERFYLRNKSISSRLLLNHEKAFIKFQSKIQKPIDHDFKSVALQLKGNYFMNYTFENFLEFYKTTQPNSVSKIEIAFDFEPQFDNFIKETVEVFLEKSNYSNWEGSKTYINMQSEIVTGITYLNSSKVIKIYDKRIELQGNKKYDLFYSKYPQFFNSSHYRIEIGYITSKRIKKVLNLQEQLMNIRFESELIEKVKMSFFKEFRILKESQIKHICEKIQGRNYHL